MSVCCDEFNEADAENIGSISNVDDSTDDATLASFYDQIPHVSDPNESCSSFFQGVSKDVNTSIGKASLGKHKRSVSAVPRSSSASFSQSANNRSSLNRSSSIGGKSKLNDSKNVSFRRKSSMTKPKNAKAQQQQQQQQKQQVYEHAVIPEHERLLRRYFNGVLKQVADRVAMADASPEVLSYYESVKVWAKAMYTQDELFTATQQTIRDLVESERLSVRAEADISADVGLQDTVSQLLAQYHPNWLRLGLEVVLDREVPTVLHRLSLRKTLDNFVFSSAQVREKYAGDCLVPSGESEQKMKKEMWTHCLSTLLVLIHFLDTLALSGQVPMWRCLFVANPEATAQHANAPFAPIKSSKAVLQQLGSLIVNGRGDLPVYLNKHQLFVQYEQKPADEIDFTIRNFMRDLPDGLRFAQAIDLMSPSTSPKLLYTLHAQDDLNAIKRKANVEKVMARVAADGVSMASLDATKVANGDPVQLVRLAWMIAYHYGTSWMINPVRVYKQIFHIQQSPVVVQPPQGSAVARRKAALDQALLTWALAIAAKNGMQIKQLSTAFSDGLLFCRIIHMYDPYLIDAELLQAPATQEPKGKQRFQNSAKTVDPVGACQRALQKACRAIGCIIEPPLCDPKKPPSSKDVTMFLCALFDSVLLHTRKLKAALVLQLFFRTIVKPLVDAKKPKRRTKPLALPRGGSSVDRGWGASSREPTIEFFYLGRPPSAAASDASEPAAGEDERVSEDVEAQRNSDVVENAEGEAQSNANEAEEEDIEIPFLDASQIAAGDLDESVDAPETDEPEVAVNADVSRDLEPEDVHVVEQDADLGLLDVSQHAAEEEEEQEGTPVDEVAEEDMDRVEEPEHDEHVEHEALHHQTFADDDLDAPAANAFEPLVDAIVEPTEEGDAVQEDCFLTITSCREVIRRVQEIAPDSASAEEYELQSILHDLQQPDLTVTDAILTMRRFGEIACMGASTCAMIAAQPAYFDILIRLICSRQRTLADIDIICHCLLVLTQVAAVAQDLDKARAKKLVDIIGELMLSYYHFETIVQCCMGAAMRLYADCAKFARICTKPKIVVSFQQIAQAWDLREEALRIAESALGYPLPRVPTTIDVYKPTTPSLRTFVDGVEPGVQTVQLFYEMISNPRGRVQLFVEEAPELAEQDNNASQHQPEENNAQDVPVPPSSVRKPGILLTPEANRSRANDLYLSPSPTSVGMLARSSGSKSASRHDDAGSLALFCTSPSSEASEELEGGWRPDHMHHTDETSFLFDDSAAPVPGTPGMDRYLGHTSTMEHSVDQLDDDEDEEESELFVGLQRNSQVCE